MLLEGIDCWLKVEQKMSKDLASIMKKKYIIKTTVAYQFIPSSERNFSDVWKKFPCD